jgi:uncharacterized protein YutE (UPF0331/DUF86 family)
MTIEQRLNHVADNYRALGYKVVVNPGPDDLPAFARDFKVEIVATKNGSGVFASAKKSQSDLEADREVPRYAELTNKEPGWRFDIFVLGPESQPEPSKIEALELTDEDIGRILQDVERMRQAGFAQQAFIAAWSVLETAMRRRLQAEGEDAGWESSPRTMLNELYSSGVLHSSDFRDLEDLIQARNAIVHGFASPVIGNGAVPFLIEIARRLLDESRAVQTTG